MRYTVGFICWANAAPGALQTIKMGAKAIFLITLVALACAANAAEEMTTMQQLQNEGIGLSAAYALKFMQRPDSRSHLQR